MDSTDFFYTQITSKVKQPPKKRRRRINPSELETENMKLVLEINKLKSQINKLTEERSCAYKMFGDELDENTRLHDLKEKKDKKLKDLEKAFKMPSVRRVISDASIKSPRRIDSKETNKSKLSKLKSPMQLKRNK